MREEMEERLKMLKAEFKAGQEILAELDTRQANVRNTLVRMSGAIQVLEEFLSGKEDATQSKPTSAPKEQALAVG
jgi:hypothetical protein